MTKKQKIFADEYLIDLNATRAYKVAYPAVKRDETAAQAGSRMLRNVKVDIFRKECRNARSVLRSPKTGFCRNWRQSHLPKPLTTQK